MAKTLAKPVDKLKVCKYCGLGVAGFHFDGAVVRFKCGAKETNDSKRISLGFRPEACKVIEVLGCGGTKLPKLESDQLEIPFPEIKVKSRSKSKVKPTKLI